MHKRIFSTMALAATLTAATAAFGGVVIVTESEEGAAGGDASAGKEPELTGRMFVEGDRVRIQGTERDADSEAEGTVIFRPEPPALLVLNDDERSYVEITPADAKRVSSALDAARAQMEAQMAKMPPEQRAMLEKAMAGFGGAPPQAAATKSAPAKAVATGKSDEVSGFSCREYDVVRDGEKIAQACIAAWKDLGVSAADLAGLKKLAAFQRDMMASMKLGDMAGDPGTEVFEVMEQVGGLPVRVRTTEAGEQPTVMRVVAIEKKDLDPKLFEVPEGYAKGAMPGAPE